MITEEQGQQQFDAADQLESAVQKGRWKGIVPDKLWLIEVEQGINIEVELDKKVKGLRLVGIPDMSEDGQYLLRLEMTSGTPCKNPTSVLNAAPSWDKVDEDPDILCQKLVPCNQIWAECSVVLDALWK